MLKAQIILHFDTVQKRKVFTAPPSASFDTDPIDRRMGLKTLPFLVLREKLTTITVTAVIETEIFQNNNSNNQTGNSNNSNNTRIIK